MPFSYRVEPENRLLYIQGDGHASLEERYHCVNQIMTDRSITPNLHVLINVCQVSNIPSTDDIGPIVSLVERLQSKFRGRVAIVNGAVGHVTVTNLISLSANCGHDKVRPFFSEDEAREWLRSVVSSEHVPPRQIVP